MRLGSTTYAALSPPTYACDGAAVPCVCRPPCCGAATGSRRRALDPGHPAVTRRFPAQPWVCVRAPRCPISKAGLNVPVAEGRHERLHVRWQPAGRGNILPGPCGNVKPRETIPKIVYRYPDGAAGGLFQVKRSALRPLDARLCFDDGRLPYMRPSGSVPDEPARRSLAQVDIAGEGRSLATNG